MKPTSDEVARFAVAVSARFGLRVAPERAGELVERRAMSHGEAVSEYLDRIDSAEPAELRALASELTVGETYFFRHIEQFRAFADVVASDRLGLGRLHVLSVGCSSGEEPYTLAMLLRESHPGTACAIRAIDVDATAIARARAARYSRWSLRATTPAFEQRWFRRDGNDVVLVPEIRSAVAFDNANALDDGALGPAGHWDVVFCRNMIMYFADDRADTLIARLARCLAPGGYLFLGHAETLRGRERDFALCHTHGAFYYRRHPAIAATGVVRSSESACVAEASATTLDAGWHHDIAAATQRVHAMVDIALDQRPGAKLAGPAAPADLGQIHELLAQERFGEALEQLDQLRAVHPGDREIAMHRALVLTHAGQFAAARAACVELLAIDASNSGANYLLALCCDSTGDADGAARLAQVAAELDPSFAMPRVHLGLLARRVGDREIASRELSRAIALLEREAPLRLALYGGGFSRQALLGMCRAELAAIGGMR